MEALINRYKRLLAATSTGCVRSLMNDIHWDARLVAIRGARGVGKTTLMLQFLKLHYADDWKTALYASLDSAYFTQHSLRRRTCHADAFRMICRDCRIGNIFCFITRLTYPLIR